MRKGESLELLDAADPPLRLVGTAIPASRNLIGGTGRAGLTDVCIDEFTRLTSP